MFQNPVRPEDSSSDGREPESTDRVTAVLRLPDLTHLGNKGRAGREGEFGDDEQTGYKEYHSFPQPACLVKKYIGGILTPP